MKCLKHETFSLSTVVWLRDKVVILQFEHCEFNFSFHLAHDDVAMGKFLNLFLPAGLRISVWMFECIWECEWVTTLSGQYELIRLTITLWLFIFNISHYSSHPINKAIMGWWWGPFLPFIILYLYSSLNVISDDVSSVSENLPSSLIHSLVSFS